MRAQSAMALHDAQQLLETSFDRMDDSASIRSVGDQLLWLSDCVVNSGKLAEALTSTTRSHDDKCRLIDAAFTDSDQQVAQAKQRVEGANQHGKPANKRVEGANQHGKPANKRVEGANRTKNTADPRKNQASLRYKDNTSDGEDPQTLTQLQPVVLEVVKDLSSRSWSDACELAPVLEQLGLFSVLSAAKHTDDLEVILHDLFNVDKVLRTNRQLRNALAGTSRSVKDRIALADKVFASSLSQLTMMLVHRVISRAASGRVLAGLRQLRVLTAQAQGKELAVIHTAHELTDSQMMRLRAILHDKCGRPVHIDTEIDPEVMGGMRIRLGADLYEGTLAASLQQVRARLAG